MALVCDFIAEATASLQINPTHSPDRSETTGKSSGMYASVSFIRNSLGNKCTTRLLSILCMFQNNDDHQSIRAKHTRNNDPGYLYTHHAITHETCPGKCPTPRTSTPRTTPPRRRLPWQTPHASNQRSRESPHPMRGMPRH